VGFFHFHLLIKHLQAFLNNVLSFHDQFSLARVSFVVILSLHKSLKSQLFLPELYGFWGVYRPIGNLDKEK
jgi:hypothetical protein